MTANTIPVRVARKRTEAEGICSFELVPADGGALPAFAAGAHVEVHLPGGITRPYSLCNSPGDTQRYRIAVLRETASRGGSATMHERVAEGDRLEIEAPAAVKTSGIVVDLITPETETSMWYFWGLARNFRPEDKALTASIREAQGKVFQEDLAMLESQQRNLSAQPERKLLSLNTDLGGVQARRIIERLVQQEQAPT